MKKTRIILVGEKLEHRAFNGSNQALPWLASALNNGGFQDVVQFDMENGNNNLERLLQKSESKDLIMFAGTFSTQLDQIDAQSFQLKQHLKTLGRGNVPIIVGGYGASGVERYAEHAPFIDAFFYGPGIEQVVQIADSVDQGRFEVDLKTSQIAGLSYYDQEKRKFVQGKSVIPPSEESFGNIDQLFMRDYVPQIHDMGDIFFDKNGRPLSTFQLVTELGCPYICSFCSESGGESEQMFVGRSVRELPLDAVKNIFSQAKEKGYRAVYFDIETAFRNWERMEKILGIMHDYGLVGGLNTRIDTAKQERIQRATELGVVYTFYGVEHINPQVLFAINKFANSNPQRRIQQSEEYVNKVEQTFKWMNDAGMQSSLFLMMGLPKIDDVSWQRLKQGKDTIEELVYTHTTFEDDATAIREAFTRTHPYHFNANILRLNPDTALAWQPQFATIRPSGKDKLDAVWFVPRVAKKLGIKLQEFHPIYRFFEGVETNQPFTTVMDPERAYDTAIIILREANMHRSHVYFDPELERTGLVQKDSQTGKYIIAPLKEFEGLESGKSEQKSDDRIISLPCRRIPSRIKTVYKWGIAVAASLALTGSWIYQSNKQAEYNQERAWRTSFITKMTRNYPLSNTSVAEFVGNGRSLDTFSINELDRAISLLTTDDPKDYFSIQSDSIRSADYNSFLKFKKSI